ncbi:MAG: lysophospholipase [Chloroflexi bacterium]|nr:lysophospholipase [Chloroflexota bacterium]
MSATSTTETVAGRDGTRLLVRSWPARGTPWATALIVHGLGEHSGRWEAVGGRMAAAGIGTTGYDHRGHGRSDGRRAYVDRWEQLLDDAEDRLVASRVAGLPAILYGQSMGGLVCADYLLSGRPAPDLAVLSAPALGDTLNPLLRALAPALGRVAGTVERANPFIPDQLSRDPKVGEAYAADPLTLPKTTLRLGAGVIAAADRVNRKVAAGATLPCPTLVIHGEDDTIIPTASTEKLGAAAGAERRTYPGVRHEPHNDPDGEAIVDATIAWLRAKAGA